MLQRSLARSARVNVPKLESVNYRSAMRRNYRWLRRDGVSPIIARLVLSSMYDAGRYDHRVATVEALTARNSDRGVS
jgi:hypothetical protein